MTQTYYKIIDVIQGQPQTLYHGNNGSKRLQYKKWLKSQQKLVRGNPRQERYTSGWHILPSYEECINYLKYFKNIEHKEIVTCKARGVWKKPTANKINVFLAKEIYIEGPLQWQRGRVIQS